MTPEWCKEVEAGLDKIAKHVNDCKKGLHALWSKVERLEDMTPLVPQVPPGITHTPKKMDCRGCRHVLDRVDRSFCSKFNYWVEENWCCDAWEGKEKGDA